MQQLLQITVTPVKYELEIEHARLEYKQDFQPRAEVQTTPSELKIQTTDTTLRLDTYNARKSLGFRNAGDLIGENADHGKKALETYVNDTVEMGNQMARIEDGVTIRDIVSRKMLEQPEMYTAFLPSSGADISWEPGNIQTNYQPANSSYDWNIQSNSMSYVPGSVRLRIVERADITIEYVGGPLYFPPSAAPDYEEPTVG